MTAPNVRGSAPVQQPQADRSGEKRQAEPEKPVQHGNYLFRHARPDARPQPRPQPPPRSPVRPRPPPQPQRPAQSAQMNNAGPAQDTQAASESGGIEDRDDEMHARRSRGVANDGDSGSQADAGAGGDAGSFERAGRWPRRGPDGKPRPPMEVRVGPELPPGARRKTVMQLSASALPGAAELFATSPGAAQEAGPLLRAMGSLLIAAARRQACPGQPSMTATTLAVEQAHLQRRPIDAPPLSLTQIKEILVELTRNAAPGASVPMAGAPAPAGDSLTSMQKFFLMLPVVMLIATRRLTPTRKDHALSILDLSRRARGLE
jgi:hypothetical protein